MPLRPVPWAIGNGAENSVELARAVAAVASSGATGIVDPTDFKVVQTPTPGAAVRVRKGTGVVSSTYPGVFGQSYIVQEQSNTDVPVAATGSSGGAVKYVYVLITDTQYGGQTPPSVENGPYNAYSVTTTLPQNQPYLLLAKIDQPKSTATITNAMITDLREVANPQILPVLRARPLIAAETETLTVTAEIGEWFPNAGAEQRINIPNWATRMIVEADWLMVREPSGNSYGQCWVEYGPWAASGLREHSTQRFQWNTANPSDVARNVWSVADDRYVPAALRGTEQVFVMKARLTGSTNNAARPQLDGESGVKMRVTFLQLPDPSTT